MYRVVRGCPRSDGARQPRRDTDTTIGTYRNRQGERLSPGVRPKATRRTVDMGPRERRPPRNRRDPPGKVVKLPIPSVATLYGRQGRNEAKTERTHPTYCIYYRAKGKIGERHRGRGEPSIYADRYRMRRNSRDRIGHNHISTHDRRRTASKPQYGPAVVCDTYKAIPRLRPGIARQRAYWRPGQRASTHTRVGNI